jgi:hypothetical protein
MSAADLLSRLEFVKQTGPGRWLARCPAHADRRPSLSVRETDDGVVLLHDFGGCDVPAILNAMGMNATDLFPPRPQHHHAATQRLRIPAADALKAIAFEAILVLVAARTMAAGDALNHRDRDRLRIAVGRIEAAINETIPSSWRQ